MSSNKTLNGLSNICANCGKEGNGITNTCNKCKMVMYCNAACKKKHRSKHKKDCEEHLKRAAENAAKEHDDKLFKQPPPLEDCPICMILLPKLDSGQTYMACCGKVICSGCVHAFRSRVTKKEHDVCPFCRAPPEEYMKRLKKRIDLNDSIAMDQMGCHYAEGLYGLPQNDVKALEFWHRAGELGHTTSFHNVGLAYELGRGVETDRNMATHSFELAAISGDADARHNLGYMEWQAGNMDRTLKHWIIAVKGGNLRSLENIKRMYKDGHATKDDYAKALRAYQAYLDEIKSDQRDKAAAANDSPYYEC